MKPPNVERVCPVEHGVPRNLAEGADIRTKRVQEFREQLLETDGAYALDPSQDAATLLDLRYATESIYLNYFWEFFIDQHACERKMSSTRFWESLFQEVQTAIKSREELFDHALRTARRGRGDALPNTLLENIDRILDELGRIPATESTTYPGSADINTFGTKLLQALHERYEKEYACSMTAEMFARFRANPLMEKTLIYWQYNSREGSAAIREVTDLTVHRKTPGSMARMSLESCVIDRETGAFGFSPHTIERARAFIAQKRALTKERPMAQRNCPVVYSQHFHEMWSWLTGLVAYQLYGEPYPTRERVAVSRVPTAFKTKMQAELAQVVYPRLPKV